jgi:hypothetical protein
VLTAGTDPTKPRTKTGTRARTTSPPPATLWLHLNDTSLLDIDMYGAAVVCERLGVLSTDLVKAWLADSTVIIRPVLHDHRATPVDRHDPPAAMADQSGSATPSASSPAAPAPPAPATWTTSRPTSP